MLDFISRLLFSRKKVEALTGIAAAFILQATGHDLAEPLSQVVVGFFGLLVTAQTILDARWGAPSDGSGNGNGPAPTRVSAAGVAAAGVVFLLVFGLACASYSGSTVRQLAAEHSALESVSVQECEALDAAAAALQEGEDQALPLVGRAAEVEHAAQVLGKQAAICWEVVARKQGAGFDPGAEARVVESFRRSWTSAAELVKE